MGYTHTRSQRLRGRALTLERTGRATVLPSLATISPQSVPTRVLPAAGGRHFTMSEIVAQKVHVGIVLDRSGSMEDYRTDAIRAYDIES